MQKKPPFFQPEKSGIVPLLSMMRYIFIFFVLYLIYKLVFDLIIPVSKATSQVRSQMKHMQEMQQQQAQPAADNRPTSSATEHKPSKDDYLDFEEIKQP